MRDKPQAPENHCPQLWERLSLTLNKDGKKSEFLTRIAEIKRDMYVLEAPIRHSGDLRLAKGDTVEVNYNRTDSAYSFKASILDLFEGDSRSISISKTGSTNRNQRRQYVRLDISGDIAFRVLENGENAGISPETKGTLLNISAGGVLFESPRGIRRKALVVLNFSLKGEQKIENVMAVIKRSEGSLKEGYLIGAEFITKSNLRNYNLEKIGQFLPPNAGTFDENLQKVIVQFIYSQQVELRKKGMAGK